MTLVDDYGYVIVVSWLLLMAVWVLGAFTEKRDVSGGSRIFRWLWQILLLGLLIFVLRNPHDDASILGREFFHFGAAVSWVGAFLTVVGIAFAIWARYRYRGKRLERATRRAADFDRHWAPLQTGWADFVGGKPSRPNPPASS